MMRTDKLTPSDASWRARLVQNDTTISQIARGAQRVAVLGIKTADAGGPAYYVPEYLQGQGLTIIPVPVYYPDATVILGEPVHRSLATVQPAADMVVLFRRPADVPSHLAELLAARPAVVWMQQGISHPATAEALAQAGITVVQDRCLLVEWDRAQRESAGAARD